MKGVPLEWPGDEDEQPDLSDVFLLNALIDLEVTQDLSLVDEEREVNEKQSAQRSY